MQQQKYLGSWNHNGEKPLPSDCSDPMKVVLTLEPPTWLQVEISKIKKKAATYKPLPSGNRLSNDEFKDIFGNSGLSVPDFAILLDTSKQTVYNILRGERGLSEDLSRKVRDMFCKPNRPQLISKPTVTNKQTDRN